MKESVPLLWLSIQQKNFTRVELGFINLRSAQKCQALFVQMSWPGRRTRLAPGQALEKREKLRLRLTPAGSWKGGEPPDKMLAASSNSKTPAQDGW